MADADPSAAPAVRRASLLRNWLSLAGLVVAGGSLFAFLLLFVIDSVAPFANPYVGILTYIVAPGFLLLGLGTAAVGAWRERRRVRRAAGAPLVLQIDLSRARDRRIAGGFVIGTVLFLLLTAVGSYHTYHFTESVQFCGYTCHTVMAPEITTYFNGPHARVACTECHIGPGATWFVRSKLSGTYQVYATLARKYPRPIPTPVANLRPAQETCEQCHWPRKFVGNVERTFTSYLSDQTNTAHAIRMLLKVGGADPTHGPVGGIHWHMNVANRVEYIALDAARQKIPWVRLTDPQGVVTEYRSPGWTNDPAGYPIRIMDCMDCHNRPAHNFQSPNDAVNLALALGKLDPALPWIKSNAVAVLTREYATPSEALRQIDATLRAAYPNHPNVPATVAAVQQIYTNNFFPDMKADWRAYPNNIGHKDWPGCVRCHDDEHRSADGRKVIKFKDCNACHVILAQGRGEDLLQLDPHGRQFVHPGEEIDDAFKCHDCHTGGR
jgi:hypothetical protein